MFSFLLGSAACFLAACHLFSSQPENLLLCAVGTDEDIKIFGSEPTGASSADTGEQDAQEYVHHKLSGNIEIAKEVGRQLGLLVVGYQPEKTALGSPAVVLQSKVLFLHAAQSCIKANSPSDIIATAAVQSLLDTVNSKEEAVYESYMGLDNSTLYRLAADEADAPESLGKLFAQLCGQKDHADFITLGSTLYQSFLEKCLHICQGVTYCR